MGLQDTNVSLQTITPAVEKQERLGKLINLLERGRFNDARDYADELLKDSVPQTWINYSCASYFKDLARTNKRRAERLARVFQEYRWECWLK